MAGETVVTLVGNLTAAPELRFGVSGAAMATMTVASTPRTFDRQAGQWRDGETLFMRCVAWRELAENAAESLEKGQRVIVTGRLVQRSFETREDERRTVVKLQVEEIDPSLRYCTALLTRSTPRTADAASAAGLPVGTSAGGGYDPWASDGVGESTVAAF